MWRFVGLSIVLLSGCVTMRHPVYYKDDMSSSDSDSSYCAFEAEKAKAGAGNGTRNGMMAGYEKGEAYRNVFQSCMRMKGYFFK